MLQRAANGTNIKTGDRVKIRRGHKRGTVQSIEMDVTKINWTKQTPHFIHVLFDDGDELLCTAGQLKRSRI